MSKGTEGAAAEAAPASPVEAPAPAPTMTAERVEELRAAELPITGGRNTPAGTFDPAALDLDALNRALPHLRRPFSPDALKFKLQTEWGTGGIIVAYIDARLVIERLNAVVGGAWEFDHEFTQTGSKSWAFGKTTVFGRSHKDYGEGRDLKAMLSDARKRSAVPFGVGVSVYALQQFMLDVGPAPHQLKTRRKGEKVIVEFKPSTTRTDGTPVGTLGWLRAQYARWLEARGELAFGPVLDHGDQAEASGFDEDPGEARQEVDEQAPDVPPIETEEAETLRGQIRTVYAAITERAPARLLPAQFAQKLKAANHSEEALKALLEELSALAREVSK